MSKRYNRKKSKYLLSNKVMTLVKFIYLYKNVYMYKKIVPEH